MPWSAWGIGDGQLLPLSAVGQPAQGVNRVNRGGGWNNTSRNCRAANRNNWEPTNRNNDIGFRLAL
ncbi:MAG: SUMF1/EgtB/PvdO family nonheme iron enzyme [Saprospiraceae bacterium]|nr:SUMF1/EgtB/PvdO family nonheme iron enzyme [Saprospiraceae bacterium]